MSPEYLDELADLADPGQLWRLSGLDQMKLPPMLRQQLDTGVALRRHADDERRMRELLGTGNSLLLTPLAINSRRVDVIATPGTGYTPACPACRSNDPTTFYRRCDGCVTRAAHADSRRRPPPPLTPGQVDGMDSTLQPLQPPRGKR